MAEKQGIDILFEGSELTTDSKDKIKTLFEAAVSEAAQTKTSELETQYNSTLEERIESKLTEIETTIDEAITYVAEQWMKENELAVESGIKTELVESFLTGLKTLFSEHYVDIPENQVDVVEEMATLIKDKDSELDSTIEENLKLKNEIVEMKKGIIISEVTNEMIDTDIERFKSLTESIKFINEDEFKTKLSTIKDSFFNEEKKEKKKDDEMDGEGEGEGESDRSGEGEELKKKVTESTSLLFKKKSIF